LPEHIGIKIDEYTRTTGVGPKSTSITEEPPNIALDSLFLVSLIEGYLSSPFVLSKLRHSIENLYHALSRINHGTDFDIDKEKHRILRLINQGDIMHDKLDKAGVELCYTSERAIGDD